VLDHVTMVILYPGKWRTLWQWFEVVTTCMVQLIVVSEGHFLAFGCKVDLKRIPGFSFQCGVFVSKHCVGSYLGDCF